MEHMYRETCCMAQTDAPRIWINSNWAKVMAMAILSHIITVELTLEWWKWIKCWNVCLALRSARPQGKAGKTMNMENSCNCEKKYGWSENRYRVACWNTDDWTRQLRPSQFRLKAWHCNLHRGRKCHQWRELHLRKGKWRCTNTPGQVYL